MIKIFKKFIYLLSGYFFIGPISYIFPKNKKYWIFGSGSGGFVDNSKYLYLWCHRYRPDVRAIWIGKNKDEVSRLWSNGYEAYYQFSLKAFYYRLRAKVFIFSSYLKDCGYFFAKRTCNVNLWHGVGIKKIEFLIENGPLAKIYKDRLLNRFVWPHIFSRPHLFLATSPEMGLHFEKSFRLKPENIIYSNYPRILGVKNHEIRSEVMAIDGTCEYLFNDKYVILYAPTFRDVKNSKNPIFNATLDELEGLNAKLIDKNAFLVLKVHPNEKVGKKIDFSNIMFWDNKKDIYPYIGNVNILVTDYSSIFYDFLNFKNKRFLMFPFDYDEYINDCRDLCFDYFENVSKNVAFTFQEFCDFLFSNANKDTEEHLEFLRKRFLFLGNSENEIIMSNILSAISKKK